MSLRHYLMDRLGQDPVLAARVLEKIRSAGGEGKRKKANVKLRGN